MVYGAINPIVQSKTRLIIYPYRSRVNIVSIVTILRVRWPENLDSIPGDFLLLQTLLWGLSSVVCSMQRRRFPGVKAAEV
jgi:hypothetical protein